MSIKILLDSGHYGKYNLSPCQTSEKYYESDFSWALHNLLKEELLKYGFVVGVTRTSKAVDKDVFDRGEMAKGYDLFLSLHSNAAAAEAFDGVDRPVICCPLKADSKVLSLGNKLGKAVLDVMKPVQNYYQIFQREHPNYPGYDYYGVLRGAIYARCKFSYIIEHGFHTDTRCTEWLLKTENRKALAVAEAKVVADWFGVSSPATTATPTTGKTIYRVQVGSYSNRTYADALVEKLKKAGFQGYVVQDK